MKHLELTVVDKKEMSNDIEYLLKEKRWINDGALSEASPKVSFA